MCADFITDIATTISELQDSGRVKELVSTAVSKGVPPLEIVEKGLRRGLDVVGRRYEKGEYFLSELLFAGVLVGDALEILGPHLRDKKVKKQGVMVLGTVRGDLHDIGKNIFKMLAQASGFEIHDLGVDVEPEGFVKELRETRADILGLSALLSTSKSEVKVVVDRLDQTGLRRKVRILLGGNAVTKSFAKEVGADGAALNAVEGLKMCKKWVTRR